MAYLGNAAMEASAPTRFIRAALWPNWQTRRLSDTSRYAPTARVHFPKQHETLFAREFPIHHAPHFHVLAF
eukprot:1176702-Prorocentrum_minimum.AAC.5